MALFAELVQTRELERAARRAAHTCRSSQPASAPVIRERVAKDTVRGRSSFAFAEMMRGVARTASGLADRIDPHPAPPSRVRFT